MTRTDMALVTTYIQAWQLVHDVPVSSPGPDDASGLGSGAGLQHDKKLEAEARIVELAIREQAKEERVEPTWMGRLLLHVYRDGRPARAFRLWDDPAKQTIPLGLVALGYDSESLVTLRLERFYQRLLVKIDEHVRVAS